MRGVAAFEKRLLVGLLAAAAVLVGCSSSSSKGTAAGGSTPTPSATSPAPSTSASAGPSGSASGPTPSSTVTPTATPTAKPTPCHARVGTCLTVRSNGDAVNVRKAPNTKATIVRTISSGYQTEVLCVSKGQAVTGPRGRSIYWDAVEGGWISDAYVGASGHVRVCR